MAPAEKRCYKFQQKGRQGDVLVMCPEIPVLDSSYVTQSINDILDTVNVIFTGQGSSVAYKDIFQVVFLFPHFSSDGNAVKLYQRAQTPI